MLSAHGRAIYQGHDVIVETLLTRLPLTLLSRTGDDLVGRMNPCLRQGRHEYVIESALGHNIKSATRVSPPSEGGENGTACAGFAPAAPLHPGHGPLSTGKRRALLRHHARDRLRPLITYKIR
jgi:hypothetical protein